MTNQIQNPKKIVIPAKAGIYRSRIKSGMTTFVQFYFRHRGLCLTVIALLVVFFVFRAPHVAHAAEADAETTDLIKSVNEIILLIMRISSAWLWPVLLMIGSLLDNDLIFGGAMGERLLAIWVQIRNLVNVVFVLILLAIAIYNVMGLGEEGGGLPLAFKTVMPKFVLALIAVNFSFLAAKVVLDFTNVITGAVFALPTNIVDSTKMRSEFEDMICGTSSNEVPMKPLWCKGKELNDRAVNFFSRLDRSNITLAYAVQFGRAPNLKFIKDGLKDLGQLGFNIIFNTVLYFVYALSFIALLLVLLFRTVALWIGVVLSPLLALSIVLPNLNELAGSGGKLKEEFVKNAIAPIKIGLVLSIGYIMLNGFSVDKSIHGEILSSSVLSAVDPNAVPTDISDLQQLMIAVGVIVIVWVGVFSVAEETAAKGITNIIRDKAQQFGTFAAKLPTYAQVIPTKTGGKVTLAQIGATLESIPSLAKEKWGGSLIGSKRELAPIRTASNPRELGRGLGQIPNLLATDAGWEAFKRKLVELKLVDEDGLKALNLGDRYSKEAMKKIFDDDRFNEIEAGIKAESNDRITNIDQFHEEVTTRKPEEQAAPAAITDSASAQKALVSAQSDGDLAKQSAFQGWSEQEIKILRDALKKFPEQVQTALLSVDADGKVDKGVTGNLSKVETVLAADPNQAVAPGSPLNQAIQSLPDTVLKAIATSKGFGDTTPLMAAIKAKNAASVGAPPPPAPPGR